MSNKIKSQLKTLVVLSCLSLVGLVVNAAVALPTTGNNVNPARDSFIKKYEIGTIGAKDALDDKQNTDAQTTKEQAKATGTAPAGSPSAPLTPTPLAQDSNSATSPSQTPPNPPPYKSLYDQSMRYKLLAPARPNPTAMQPDSQSNSPPQPSRPNIYK